MLEYKIDRDENKVEIFIDDEKEAETQFNGGKKRVSGHLVNPDIYGALKSEFESEIEGDDGLNARAIRILSACAFSVPIRREE